MKFWLAIPELVNGLLFNPLGAVVFFLAACAGHTFFMVIGLNVLYAWALPHCLLRFTRKIDILMVLLGPVLFAYAMGFHDGGGVSWQWGERGFLLTPYLAFCWMLGFFVVPAALLLYHLRRQPLAVVGNQTETVDVARELGYPPVGRSRQAYLARLPFNQVFQVDFTQCTFQLPQLPAAWDGLSILHLSDLHFCGTPDRDFYKFVMDRCLKWGTPDLIALTGDVVDTWKHHRWIVPLLGRLLGVPAVRERSQAFAILGNHDSWREPLVIRRRLRKIGFHVLGNGWEQVEIRGQPMVVIGNEYPWFGPEADLSGCPPPLSMVPLSDGRGSEGGVFRLCLSHSPDRISWCRRHRVDLMLAGHVHGGQIRLPLIGSLFVPSRYSRRYDQGTFFEPPTLMHVNRGLAGQHPLRFNCRPQVNWLVLRKGAVGGRGVPLK